MKIIFVYAGDPHNTANYAPFTITRHLFAALNRVAPVTYYDWCSCGPFVEVGSDDIIIGHPNYPAETAVRRLFQNNCRAKILIFPFHHGLPGINLPFDDLVNQCDALLSITGPYWYDTIESTPFAAWKEKMTRVDMAIDAVRFPVVKTSFSEPGKRQFFYIGADRFEKGLSVLESIFAGTSHKLHLYGMIDGAHPINRLPNVHLHGWADVCEQFAVDLAQTADCLVHGGISDAKPTTLLEATSWGFPVACTPQSGYWPDQPFYGLNPGDIDGSRAFLDYIQWVPADVLRMRAQQNREVVRQNHNWDRFIGTVLGVVKRFL